jgi:hypothetical protein
MTDLCKLFARNDILISNNINDFVRMKEARHNKVALRKATEHVA